MRNWMIPAAVAGGVTLGVLGLATFAVIDDDPTPVIAQDPAPVTAEAAARRVTVDGVGTVSGTPDLLTITMGVQVQAPTAVEALRTASQRASTLIDTLKSAGVADVDLQTADISVWPRYDRDGQQVTGYQANQSVVAKLRDLDRAGAVIDAAAGAVGNEITLGGLSFSIADTGPLYEQARELAVQQAKAHADQLARAAGVSVGRVLTIDETAQEVPAPVRYAEQAGAADSAVPIEPGSQTLRLTVQVAYELTG